MSEPRRILFLNTLGIVGGQEVVMLDIVRNLDARRYAARAACLLPGPLVDALESLGVPTTVLPRHRIRRPVTFARAVRELGRIIERERVDVVHCNGDTLLLYGALASLRRRTPCVWHVYEPVVTGGSSYAWLFYQTQRRLPRAWTIFGTAAVEESYLHHYPDLGPHSAIMPGVDIDALVQGADPGAARRRLGIPENAPLLLAIGRLQRSKGLRELVEATARLNGRFEPPHVVLCGGKAVMTDEDFEDELT
ncbi:MAG TPA: glycosyltransferase family 4 protein, partial [Polyangiaceae bacterium]